MAHPLDHVIQKTMMKMDSMGWELRYLNNELERIDYTIALFMRTNMQSSIPAQLELQQKIADIRDRTFAQIQDLENYVFDLMRRKRPRKIVDLLRE
jgi:hypothetical protein